MKFYGFEIGCHKVLKMEPNTEVITFTVFSIDDRRKVFQYFLDLALLVGSQPIEGYLSEDGKNPEINSVISIEEAKKCYPYTVIPIRIKSEKINYLKDLLEKAFPKSNYIQLNNK